MPDGKTKKLKKSMRAAAADYASASPLETKAKKKQKKSVCPEEVAAVAAAATARADYDSASPSKKKTKKKPGEKAAAADFASPSLPKKKTKKTKGEKQEEEKSQIKKIPNGSEDQSPSLYLVVRHAVECPAYSLYRLKHTLVTADHPSPVPCRVKYLDAEHDMSFAAVSSQRRSWIVGVGGFPDHQDRQHGGRGETIVFDCKTGLVAKGPRPTASKSEPVLVVVGEKVYALARMPNIWRQSDFPPWFEVLDVSDASCIDGQLTYCSWLPLPSPPLFPILNQEGFWIDSGPALVDVESYAVVGHYILLSIVRDPFTDREAGTVAFDTSTDKWHYVDHQKNLPFIGEAVPYDGLYLGRSRSKDWNDLTAYNISMTKTKTGTTPNLSIVEVSITVATTNNLPVTSGQFFSSLGNEVICAVGCCTEGWTCNEELEKDDIYINIHSCVDAEEKEESKTQRPGEIVLSNNPAMYAFSVREPIYKLIAPSLVAALCIHMI